LTEIESELGIGKEKEKGLERGERRRRGGEREKGERKEDTGDCGIAHWEGERSTGWGKRGDRNE